MGGSSCMCFFLLFFFFFSFLLLVLFGLGRRRVERGPGFIVQGREISPKGEERDHTTQAEAKEETRARRDRLKTLIGGWGCVSRCPCPCFVHVAGGVGSGGVEDKGGIGCFPSNPRLPAAVREPNMGRCSNGFRPQHWSSDPLGLGVMIRDAGQIIAWKLAGKVPKIEEKLGRKRMEQGNLWFRMSQVWESQEWLMNMEIQAPKYRVLFSLFSMRLQR
uniref:Uncharacterized protein n=1 Tax=Oryza punctata TaxID=4537 RepID=A0A0E0K910_ORYPU